VSNPLDNISTEELTDIVNSGKLSELASAIRNNSPNPPAPSVCVKSNENQGQETSERSEALLPNTLSQEADKKMVEVSGESKSVTSNDATRSELLVPQRASGFDIKDPVELLFLLDDDIASGEVTLHDWQIQFMLDFALDVHTKELPFTAAVQAANGSGKDKYIVAACVVWICMRYLQARGVVTNGSGVQLDNQTEVYIRQLCERANAKIAPNIWKCNYRYYECLATGSPITLFATDEANKAEGYHPLVSGGKMAIFASEAKAIPDEIFTALGRCTGYTHRVDVSTPGNIIGYFYETCTTALDRNSIKDIKELNSTQYLLYKVTAYQCSHITPQEIEAFAAKLPGGKNSPVFKSGMLAEFGATDEMVVIPYTYVWMSVNKTASIKHIEEPHNKAGLDLSDGGNETVLSVRNGNRLLKVIPFKFDNTEDTVSFLEDKFKENDLTHPDSYIFGDCVGMGKPILDRLKRKGWSNIRYFDSRGKAYQPTVYRNRNAEVWFHFKKLLERKELILFYEKVLQAQLAARYYKIIGSIHQLLSKLEQRARGYPSPDRADSVVMCFLDYKSTFREVDPEADKPFKQPEVTKPVSEFTLKEWAKRGTDSPNESLNPSKGKNFSVYRASINRYNSQLTKTVKG